MAQPRSDRGSRGINLYGYVHNNPVNLVDPLGLWAAGINLEFSTINPFTSRGGGSYGLNLDYTSSSGLLSYGYYTPGATGSVGFLVGPSLTLNVASGTGDWTGAFISTAGSYGSATAGAFESDTWSLTGEGYKGLSFGLGRGLGFGATETIYKRLFPDEPPCP